MRLLILLLFIITCIGSNSCQKELSIDQVDSTVVTIPTVSGSFTAKIDGAQFVADKAVMAVKASNVIAITGQDNNGQTIFLRVADSGVHVYTLDINSASNGGAYTKDSAYAYATNQGSSAAESGGILSVTSIDTVKKTISGTFSMNVYRVFDLTQKNIMEGVFNNISYSTIAVPPAGSTDTFRVKVDGVQFPVFSIDGISVFNTINLAFSDQLVTKTVGVSFPSNITAGTYKFALFDPNYIGQYNVDSSYLPADSGTLTILEHNITTKRIRGNFNFHVTELLGTETFNLTEGYFSLVYQ